MLCIEKHVEFSLWSEKNTLEESGKSFLSCYKKQHASTDTLRTEFDLKEIYLYHFISNARIVNNFNLPPHKYISQPKLLFLFPYGTNNLWKQV